MQTTEKSRCRPSLGQTFFATSLFSNQAFFQPGVTFDLCNGHLWLALLLFFSLFPTTMFSSFSSREERQTAALSVKITVAQHFFAPELTCICFICSIAMSELHMEYEQKEVQQCKLQCCKKGAHTIINYYNYRATQTTTEKHKCQQQCVSYI